MTIEEQLYTALEGLAEGRVFPDIAPQDTPTPYITYQAVGGEPIDMLDGTIPDKSNVRMQINVWSKSRIEASELGALVELTIRQQTSMQPTVLTGRVATLDEETQYRGTMQDFSLFA